MNAQMQILVFKQSSISRGSGNGESEVTELHVPGKVSDTPETESEDAGLADRGGKWHAPGRKGKSEIKE